MAGAKEDKLDLAGVAEAAKIIGVPKSSIPGRRERDPEFPKPVALLRCGPIWRTSQIRAYARRQAKRRLKEEARVRRIDEILASQEVPPRPAR